MKKVPSHGYSQTLCFTKSRKNQGSAHLLPRNSTKSKITLDRVILTQVSVIDLETGTQC